MTLKTEFSENILDAEPFIDPKQWPEYLTLALKAYGKKLDTSIVNVKDLDGRLVSLEATIRNAFNGELDKKLKDAIERAVKFSKEESQQCMKDHMQYHSGNEKKWGIQTLISNNIWKTLLVVLIVGTVIGVVFYKPMMDLLEILKIYKAAGLIK